MRTIYIYIDIVFEYIHNDHKLYWNWIFICNNNDSIYSNNNKHILRRIGVLCVTLDTQGGIAIAWLLQQDYCAVTSNTNDDQSDCVDGIKSTMTSMLVAVVIELYISNNSLDETGDTTIANMLMVNKTLETLNISNNQSY